MYNWTLKGFNCKSILLLFDIEVAVRSMEYCMLRRRWVDQNGDRNANVVNIFSTTFKCLNNFHRIRGFYDHSGGQYLVTNPSRPQQAVSLLQGGNNPQLPPC